MSRSNVQIVQEFIEEVFNNKHYDRAFDYCTEDCVFRAAPYVGIGAEFDDRSGDKIVVVNVASGGPAAGNLQKGDELVCVTDGVNTWDTFKELDTMVWGRGVVGTPLTLTVKRDGKDMDLILKRGRVEAFDMVLSDSLERWRDYTLKYWPDLKSEIKVIFGDGDYVACYAIDSGTNQEYHRSAVWPELSIYHLKDGKIVESWGIEDSLSQMNQLGYQLTPPVTESAA